MTMHEGFYELLLDALQEGIYFVNEHRQITYWNKGAEIITGYTKEEMIGRYCYENTLNHVDENGIHLCLTGCPLHATIDDYKERDVVVYLSHKQGHRVKVKAHIKPIFADGKIIGCSELFSDISNRDLLIKHSPTQHYSVEALKILALHDHLSGLPNRRYIESFFHSRLNDFNTLNIPFGVIYMDIDNFGVFNNDYGHDVGDEVIKILASSTMSAIRKSDMIGRWGGEEFVAILTAVNEKELAMIAEKIRMLIENSICKTKNKDLRITVSIGATVVQPFDTMDSIIKRADKLMYESKKSGKNKVTSG